MPRIKFKTRKSRLAERICTWFRDHRGEDLSFGAILDKYCEEGMSRRYVKNLLMEMTDKKGARLGDSVQIKDTPLWESWKAEVAQGRCDFVFRSKFPGNIYHGNKGKAKRKKSTTPKVLEEKIAVEYACLSCGHNETGQAQTTGEPRHLIALKAHKCKGCGEFGSSVGKFEIDGETVHKAVVENTEQFVESKGSALIPIERNKTAHG